jgi:hypothetical protein
MAVDKKKIAVYLQIKAVNRKKSRGRCGKHDGPVPESSVQWQDPQNPGGSGETCCQSFGVELQYVLIFAESIKCSLLLLVYPSVE